MKKSCALCAAVWLAFMGLYGWVAWKKTGDTVPAAAIGFGRSDFTGLALAPCAIDAIRGPARILGWSMLEEFPKARTEDVDPARALAYLRGATFEPLGLSNALSVLSRLHADQDGALPKDLRIGDGAPELEGRQLSETIAPVGSKVTIFGIWSEAERGFKPAGTVSMNRLYPVSAELVVSDVRSNAAKTFGIALFFFIALHVILLPMYFLAPKR